MDEKIEILARTKLFSGIAADGIEILLKRVQARYVKYSKSEFIIEEGNRVCDFGIMVSGRGRVIKWDEDDKVFIITFLEKGSDIGVLLAASFDHISSVSVQALEDAEILFLSFDSIFTRYRNAGSQYDRFLRNYINTVAEKGLMLHERISCLLRPTVRDKIMTYLLRISSEQGRRAFSIPMNRNVMAQYLNIERSALSRELSNMKKDGLIGYRRNCFEIK